MSEFTPGPWVVSGGSVWAIPQDGSNLGIAQPWAVLDYVSMGERNANAALIAAAPDMYAALESSLKVSRALYAALRQMGGQLMPTVEAVNEASAAALAKADGTPTQSPAPNQPASPREP